VTLKKIGAPTPDRGDATRLRSMLRYATDGGANRASRDFGVVPIKAPRFGEMRGHQKSSVWLKCDICL
jgi:hypothetical protein